MLSTKFKSRSSKRQARNRLYVIADIHGHAEELDLVLSAIFEDMRQHPLAKCDIVIDGDMINRGPHSKAVLDRLVRLSVDKPAKCTVTILKGNHEISLMHFLKKMEIEKDIEARRDFLKQGGVTTLASYGVFITPHDVADASKQEWEWVTKEDIEKAQIELMLAFPVSHKRLIRDASHEFWYRPDDTQKKYYICHGGVNPFFPLDDQSKRVLLGADYDDEISREFAKYKDEPLKDEEGQEWTVIHGHTIIGKTPEITKARISLDTGCYKGGRLSSIVISDGEVEGLIQCDSLYPRFNAHVIPTADNWPPKQIPQTIHSSWAQRLWEMAGLK